MNVTLNQLIVGFIILVVLYYLFFKKEKSSSISERFTNTEQEKLNDIIKIIKESTEFRDYLEKLNNGHHFDPNIGKLNTFVLLKEFDKQNLLTPELVFNYL